MYEYISVFATAVSLQVMTYMFFRGSLDAKRRSWLLSLGTSGLFTAISTRNIYIFVNSAYEGTTLALTTNKDPFDCATMIWLISYLLLDCVIGLIDYPSQLRIDTTWIHHTFFIICCVVVLNTHTYSLFVLFLPFEIPTFVMALGTIFPSLRNDLLFGGTFFVFRIVYQSILFGYWLTVPGLPHGMIIGSCLPTTIMHFIWFYKWCRGYLFKGKIESQVITEGESYEQLPAT